LTLVVPKIFGVAGAETPPEMAFWYRPEIYYFGETAVYIGVAALLLGSLGVVSKYLGGLRWFLAGMALLGLLYGLGDHFFVHPILSKLPLFGTFRSPVRLAIYFSLGGALLAGVGLERCIRADEEPDKMVRVLYIVGGIIVLIGFLTVSGTLASMLDAPAQVAARVSGSGIDALLIGVLSAAVAWAALRRKAPAGGAAVALIIFCVIDLSFFGMGQNTAPETGNPELTYQMYDGQFAQFKAAPPQKLFRVKMREGGAMLMERNQGPYISIMLFEGYNPLLLKRRVPPAATPERAYDFMNIRYGVQANPQTGQAVMAERPNAYPHARILYDARVGSTDQILGWLKDTTIDYTRTVLLEKAPSTRPDGSGTGTATITRYDAGEIEASVTTDKPGILVLSEVWYPAWRVTVDGNEAELLTADYSLRGVAVPAGKHTVVMRYQSDSFRTGSWISIIGSLAALGGAIFMGIGRRKKRGGDGGESEN
jgi:hypothetical protein